MQLFVFDESLSFEELSPEAWGDQNAVFLFSLTANWTFIRRLEQELHKRGLEQVVVLNAARFVERESENLSRGLPEWSAKRGMSRIRNVSIRRFFMTSDGGMSGFWLGPISEKNPFKTDTFLELAQALAIQKQLRTGKYDRMAVAIKSRNLCKSIKRMADVFGMSFHLEKKPQIFSTQGMKALFPGIFLLALAGWLQACQRAMLARLMMGFSQRETLASAPHVFVSYFSYLNGGEGGVFRNRYFEPIQEMYSRQGERILWLLIFARVGGIGFWGSLKMARKFRKNGEHLAFFDEFFGFKEAFTALCSWLRQVGRYFVLERSFDEEQMCGALFPVECYPLVENLWRRSFCGIEAMRGLIQYEAFKRFFSVLENPSLCVYPCEMQAWEKAMNRAILRKKPALESVGFVHTTLSRNFISFIHHKSELESYHLPDGLPIPGRIAVNGGGTNGLLSEWGYPHLFEVEGIRQISLAKNMNYPLPAKARKPTLLVAGSFSREETKSFLSFLQGAYPLAGEWDVWLKGHPLTPMGLWLNELGVQAEEYRWNIKEGDIYACLQRVDAVLVPSSSVSIDALAYGCEVFVPVVSSAFSMNLLTGHEGYYRSFSTPEELREKLGAYLEYGPSKSLGEKRDFVRSYWNLDPELPRWRELLNMKAVDKRHRSVGCSARSE